MAGDQRPRGRTGFEETHGEAPRNQRRAEGPRRQHEQEPAAEAFLDQGRLDPPDVAVDQRQDVRIDDGRGRPLELADLRADLTADADRELRELVFDQCLHLLLMRRVLVRVQERHGDRLDLLSHERGDPPPDLPRVERGADLAVARHAFGHFHAPPPRHQRLRIL